MSIQNAIFETSEFELASFLLAEDTPLLGIRATSDPRRKLFVFKSIDALQTLITDFWSGKKRIEPRRLLNAEKELKRLLRSDSYSLFQGNNQEG